MFSAFTDSGHAKAASVTRRQIANGTHTTIMNDAEKTDSRPPVEFKPISPWVKDITGKRFGRYIAIGFVGVGNQKQARWLCRCDCGTEKVVNASDISKGTTESCGCVHRERSSESHYKHGGRANNGFPSEYLAWLRMRQRCYYTGAINYSDYGGRGIRVCRGWDKSFEVFLADMGRKPSPTHSIDRINNDGHYSCGKCDDCRKNGWPMNCRWATMKEQQNNRRSNKRITYNGKTQNLTQWADELGMTRSLIGSRLLAGWSVEDALTRLKRIIKWKNR